MDKQKRPPQEIKSSAISEARKALKQWHSVHGRHDLPWRVKYNPYHVLVSEFMLQQTSVTTVIPRFQEWMRSFPTLGALALAREEKVLSAWEGLGYYSRARRLHAASQAIMERHAGHVPTEEGELLALPGIGAYTAAAIRAFAHDLPAIVLDTNIIRVIARWGNMQDSIDSALGRKSLESIACNFFPQSGCRTLASSLMDLGALVCTAGMPDCKACPLKKTCSAVNPERLPKKSPRPVTTKLIEHRACFHHGNRLFLEQSTGPKWTGLWILPDLGKMIPEGRPLAEITYPITRYHVTMKIHRVSGKIPPSLQGFTREEASKLPMPSPFRKALLKLHAKLS